MNAIDRDDFNYSDQAPVLIGASSDAALERAVRTVEASGARIGDTMTLDHARERIDRQVSATGLARARPRRRSGDGCAA